MRKWFLKQYEAQMVPDSDYWARTNTRDDYLVQDGFQSPTGTKIIGY